MSRQGISVQPIWEIKLSYYLFEWGFWTHISWYLMEIVLTFITWLLLYCGLLVHAMTKGDNDFSCQRQREWTWKKKKNGSEMTDQLSPSQCKYKCNYGSVNWFDSVERGPLPFSPFFTINSHVTFERKFVLIGATLVTCWVTQCLCLKIRK